MATLSAAVLAMVRTKTRGRIVTSCQPVSVLLTPSSANHDSEMKRPSMKTSPWAKLISSMMPYTIVYPRAISANTAPRVRPLIACWARTSHPVMCARRARGGGRGGPRRAALPGRGSLEDGLELELAADRPVRLDDLESRHGVVVHVAVLVEAPLA